LILLIIKHFELVELRFIVSPNRAMVGNDDAWKCVDSKARWPDYIQKSHVTVSRGHANHIW